MQSVFWGHPLSVSWLSQWGPLPRRLVGRVLSRGISRSYPTPERARVITILLFDPAYKKNPYCFMVIPSEPVTGRFLAFSQWELSIVDLRRWPLVPL